ncbi:hypothetical protein [Acidocella facilis]|uniref:hypothetical protein n=1 Tax=Acidocella facilis TaxID=525 RepID=UPI0012DD42F7|nr:hypothetical protein [Acidocella facilis]
MGAGQRETGRVSTWLPFSGEGPALLALAAYAQHIQQPHAAIIWVSLGGAKILRPGVADKDGDVPVLIAHAHGSARPPATRPASKGALLRFEDAAASVLSEAWGKTKEEVKAADEWIERHPLKTDGVVVGFDAVAAIGGVIAIGFLGVAAVGTLGMIATGAAIVLLAADSAHFTFEMMAAEDHSEFGARMAKGMEKSIIYQGIEWIAPLLCLPDLAFNLPKAIREVGVGIREGKEAVESLEKGAQLADKAEQRLSNYIQRRGADGAKPALQATEQRYQRAISAAKRTEAELKSKLDDTLAKLRKSKIGEAIEIINAPGTVIGAGLDVVTHARQAVHGMRWA